MVFVKYDQDLKIIAVKMKLRGMTLNEINTSIAKSISHNSLAHWLDLYQRTDNVVKDPALYLDQGRPLTIRRDESQFILDALEAEPTLYLDEIQSHIEAMTGVRHPVMTISNELKSRLHLTKNLAQTVHPAQCPLRRAEYTNVIGPCPSHFLVFLGGFFSFFPHFC